MTGLSLNSKIAGDRFLAVSILKQQLAREVNEKYTEEAVVLFKSASRAKVLEAKGVKVYSSYSQYMNAYDDIEGFLVAFEKDFSERLARKTFFLKEHDNFVEVYDEFCHGCIEVTLVAATPRNINLYDILQDEAATLADLFF